MGLILDSNMANIENESNDRESASAALPVYAFDTVVDIRDVLLNGISNHAHGLDSAIMILATKL